MVVLIIIIIPRQRILIKSVVKIECEMSCLKQIFFSLSLGSQDVGATKLLERSQSTC